ADRGLMVPTDSIIGQRYGLIVVGVKVAAVVIWCVDEQVRDFFGVEMVGCTAGCEVLDKVITEVIQRCGVWCVDRLSDGGREIDQQFPEVVCSRHEIIEVNFTRVNGSEH